MRTGRLVHDRLLGHRVGLHLVVGWGVALALLPRLAWGDAVLDPTGAPSGSVETGASTPGERIGDDPAALREGREERIIRARLRELGASATDADTVVARLSPAERTEVARRAPELAAGGSAAAPILAVAIIIGLLVILVLELIGRRVVSRPAT